MENQILIHTNITEFNFIPNYIIDFTPAICVYSTNTRKKNSCQTGSRIQSLAQYS